MKHPNRIRELREKVGLTQQELGNRFKTPKDLTVISRWERGIVKPSSQHLLELAKILKANPQNILLPDYQTDKSVI